MIRKPKNSSGRSAPKPIDDPFKPRLRRDKEIEQLAVEDARKSFSMIRDLLNQEVGPDAPPARTKRA